MEQLRLNNNFSYSIHVDPTIDPEEEFITPLLIQPFIENAIWHGISSKEDGKISLSITQGKSGLICTIEDNGVGRKRASEIKSENANKLQHRSGGINVTQKRLELLGKLSRKRVELEIKDLLSNTGISTGTRVELKFPAMN